MATSHDTAPTEVEYRPIVGFTNYRVGSDGTIWSFVLRLKSWVQLKTQDGAGGYPRAVLNRNGKRFYRAVHILVLEAFVGARPRGMEGCHNDGDKRNNRSDNLRWDTHANNMDDQLKTGGRQAARGSSHYCAKLTEQNIPVIRLQLAQGENLTAIGRGFGVSAAAILNIAEGRTWAHILWDGPPALPRKIGRPRKTVRVQNT